MFKRLLIVLLGLPSIVSAQQPSKVTLVSDFWEVERPSAEISGARVMGFARVGVLQASKAPLQLSADIPGDWAGKEVCLRVNSADSLYESRNSYRVAEDWPGGTVPLDYPTTRLERLRQLPPGGLSVLLSLNACGEDGGEAASVTWGTPDGAAPALYLNTSRADETFMFFDAYPDLGDIPCQAADSPVRNSFDTVCPLPEALAGVDALDASFLSFRNGEMGRVDAVRLHPAAGPAR